MSEMPGVSAETGSRGPYRVCLFGVHLDAENLGVGALAISLIGLILDARPDARIVIMCGEKQPALKRLRVGERTVTVEVVNYRRSPRAQLRVHILWILAMALLYRLVPVQALRRWICRTTPWVDALAQADFVGEIFGGDSFSDIYGVTRLAFLSLPCLTALILGKSPVLLPQTYGPYQSKIARLIARAILHRAARVYARDRKSQAVASAILGQAKGRARDAEFCPDVAFTLPVLAPRNVPMDPPLPGSLGKKPLIGLNVSGLLYLGGFNPAPDKAPSHYKYLLFELIRNLLEHTDAHILIVPHVLGDGYESDLTACNQLMPAMAKEGCGRLHRLQGMRDPQEIKWVIGQCDFFIGSRMHSCIAALSQGIPCIGLAYSVKFGGVFETVGAGHLVIDYSRSSIRKVVSRCLELYQAAGAIRDNLAGMTPAVRQSIHEAFRKALHAAPRHEPVTAGEPRF